MNANGMGIKITHKQPKSVQAQAVPMFSYNGYVVNGMRTAARTLRVKTLDARADAL